MSRDLVNSQNHIVQQAIQCHLDPSNKFTHSANIKNANYTQIRIRKQCDQIWRNFTTLQKFTSLWQHFDRIFIIWQNADIFGLIFLLKMARY